MNEISSQTQQTSVRLAWAGVIPFIVSAAMGIIGIYQAPALHAFLIYSAVILSFLGGIHWGLIMRGNLDRPQGRLLICIAPPLTAWIAVAFLPPLLTLAILGLFYMLWLKYDTIAVQDDWYIKMRKPITFIVTGSHFLWFIALASERALQLN